MTLSAQDVQTACFADLLLVDVSGLAMLGQRSQVFLCRLVAGSGATRRFLAVDLRTRHKLGVATEQDVGAATCHVGGDRDLLAATGLGDDGRLTRVVLGV